MDDSSNKVKATFKVSLKKGEVEISGSEEFVSEQVSNFNEIIKTSFARLLIEEQSPNSSSSPKKQYQFNSLPSNISDTQEVDYEEADYSEVQNKASYENVFIIDDDRVRIIAEVPGKNISQTMINIILIYMWGKYLQGSEDITFKELRIACEEYGAVDKAHFASTIKKQKKIFLVNGTGRNLSLKLTGIGLRRAQKLVEELNSTNEE